MHLQDATESLVTANVRQLVDQLVQSSQRGAGAHLTPEDVDRALVALRAHAGMVGAPKIKLTRRTFQIELMDGQGWPEEVLAVVRDDPIARAAFDEAVKQRPGRKIRLRHGARVVAEAE
jgi:hypothetical protein